MAEVGISPELISKLKFINTDGLIAGKYNFPDFLIIGPQRTGTTWLHRNLILHPYIFIPYDKELHFFSYLKIKTSAGWNYSSDRLEWYSEQFSRNIKSFIKKNIILYKSYRSLKHLDYNLVRFLHPAMIGDATASYAVMENELISEIFKINPDIKIIMMIRNPIERAWSHAKLVLLKDRHMSTDDVGFDKFEEFYTSDYISRCGRYPTIINNWKKFVKPNNFFIGAFDDISLEPKDLLVRIFNFLGVHSEIKKVHENVVHKKIKPTVSKKIPDSHAELLFELFNDDIEEMNKKYELQW